MFGASERKEGSSQGRTVPLLSLASASRSRQACAAPPRYQACAGAHRRKGKGSAPPGPRESPAGPVGQQAKEGRVAQGQGLGSSLAGRFWPHRPPAPPLQSVSHGPRQAQMPTQPCHVPWEELSSEWKAWGGAGGILTHHLIAPLGLAGWLPALSTEQCHSGTCGAGQGRARTAESTQMLISQAPCGGSRSHSVGRPSAASLRPLHGNQPQPAALPCPKERGGPRCSPGRRGTWAHPTCRC